MSIKITLLLCFFIQFSIAQTRSKIDSLKFIVNKVKGEEKFKVLNSLADEYSNVDLVIAKKYAHLSVDQAIGLKNDKFIGLSYNSLANVFQFQSKLDSALFYHQKALNYRKRANDSIGIADSYNNLGIAYDQKANYESALKNYFLSLKMYEKLKNLSKQAMVNTNIGIVYKAQNDFKKALYYYKNSYDIYVRIKNEVGAVISSGNLGSIYINFKDYSKALLYSKKAKEGYYKLGYERFAGYPIATIAVVNDSLKKYQVANQNYRAAIALHQKYKNTYEVADVARSFASCLLKQNNISESIKYAQESLKASKEVKAKLIEMQAFETLSKAFAKSNNFTEAYKFSELYLKVKDSLFELSKTKAIFDIEAKYQTEKKEKLLIQKDAESKKKSLWLLIISLLVGFTALLGYLFFRQQKIKNNQQKQEFELKSVLGKIEAQNQLQEQRLEISRDLHDNIGSQLTFVISSLDSMKFGLQNPNYNLENKLSQVSDFTKTTIVELRDTIWAMNTNDIVFDDLKTRILNFINQAKVAKETIDFQFYVEDKLKDKKLSSIEWVNIYRTIQEVVNNAIKHAEASKIIIEVAENKDGIAIVIQDNGKGFNRDEVVHENGLLNIEKRIQSIGGVISVNSIVNQGTTIKIEI